MKKNILARVFVMAFFISLPVRARSLEMPKEIPNVSVGMSVEELKAARPKAWITASKLPLDIDKMKTGKFLAMEDLPPGGDFSTASYGVVAGKVNAITLMGDSQSGAEKGLRRRLMKEGIQRWGKKFNKRAPEDNSRPGTAQPTITWEVDGVEIALSLPRTRKNTEKRPYYAAIVFRPASAVKTHPWKELPLQDADKKKLFKDNDVED